MKLRLGKIPRHLLHRLECFQHEFKDMFENYNGLDIFMFISPWGRLIVSIYIPLHKLSNCQFTSKLFGISVPWFIFMDKFTIVILF